MDAFTGGEASSLLLLLKLTMNKPSELMHVVLLHIISGCSCAAHTVHRHKQFHNLCLQNLRNNNIRKKKKNLNLKVQSVCQSQSICVIQAGKWK